MSTCMEYEIKYKWEEISSSEGATKKKRKRKKKERKEDPSSSPAFRRSELIGLRSKVQRFDEGLRFKR